MKIEHEEKFTVQFSRAELGNMIRATNFRIGFLHAKLLSAAMKARISAAEKTALGSELSTMRTMLAALECAYGVRLY